MNINNMRAIYNQKTDSYLRYHATTEWKQECFKKANNMCEITGHRGKPTLKLTVHHASESFLSISKRAHKQLGIRYHKFTNEYKPEDLQALVSIIKEEHKDVVGAVMTENMHAMLHKKFTNPTYDDYKQFKKNYKRQLYQRKNSSYRKKIA